jgi:hypothetical protein
MLRCLYSIVVTKTHVCPQGKGFKLSSVPRRHSNVVRVPKPFRKDMTKFTLNETIETPLV